MGFLVAIACLVGAPILGFYWGVHLAPIGLIVSIFLFAVIGFLSGKKSTMDSFEGTLKMVVFYCSFLFAFGVLFGASETIHVYLTPYLDMLRTALFKTK